MMHGSIISIDSQYICATKRLTFTWCLSLVEVCRSFLYRVMGAYHTCLAVFGHVFWHCACACACAVVLTSRCNKTPFMRCLPGQVIDELC